MISDQPAVNSPCAPGKERQLTANIVGRERVRFHSFIIRLLTFLSGIQSAPNRHARGNDSGAASALTLRSVRAELLEITTLRTSYTASRPKTGFQEVSRRIADSGACE